MRESKSFFCTSIDCEYFDFEKLATYLILYSNSDPKEKIIELFELLSTACMDEKGRRLQRILNDKSGKIERIFGYMVYLTCRVPIENVLRDERRRKGLGKAAVELMDKINRIANEEMVLN